MKRLIYALMSTILIFGYMLLTTTATTRAFAASNLSVTYARATNREAYIYTSYDLSSSLFAVPYTYLVKILGGDGDVYYVSYAEDEGAYREVYGYCKKTDFEKLYGVPKVTYLNKTVQVTYAPKDSNQSLPTLTTLSVEAAYYGAYYSGGKTYFYVLCGDSFGYIAGSNEDYPLLSEDNIQPTSGETTTSETTTSGMGTAKTAADYAPQIITAVALTILAALSLTLIFTRHRRR